MKQRLGIAIALLNNPKLLILDETGKRINPLGIQELRDLIRNFPKGNTKFGFECILVRSGTNCRSYRKLYKERELKNVKHN